MTRFAPIAVFAALVGFAIWGLLFREDRDALPSELIGTPAPQFSLPILAEAEEASLDTLLKDGPIILNYWASWCVPCRVEHPEFMKLAEMGHRIIGVNYKDKPEDATRFVQTLGNPFEKILIDNNGRTAVDFGVIGVPETFIISRDGSITYKHTGPINPGELEGKVLPAIRAVSK